MCLNRFVVNEPAALFATDRITSKLSGSPRLEKQDYLPESEKLPEQDDRDRRVPPSA
jgi:hypothetical protein